MPGVGHIPDGNDDQNFSLFKHLRVYLPYRYEWETGERISRIDEPEHRPYFSWYKLRKAVSQ
jgi:hypothetical protein